MIPPNTPQSVEVVQALFDRLNRWAAKCAHWIGSAAKPFGAHRPACDAAYRIMIPSDPAAR